MMKRKEKEKGRALYYTRDSGGKHETTPTEYVGWAQKRADELGLQFSGTTKGMEMMIHDGLSSHSDMFLDYGISGNVMSRPGLNALIDTALKEISVSHVLIPRRNRLAHPQNVADAIQIEHKLRSNGITIVFMNTLLEPIAPGQRGNIAELICSVIDYDRSAEDRRELAEKVLYAQLNLAKAGFSTGGRPPYGFRRCLATEDGKPVRELAEGERVKRRGHHVLWLPGPKNELDTIRRILKMLRALPASRVAKILTGEGVPTPDHGRTRTDSGVCHKTSGVWHQSTIVSIARNPLLLLSVEYGRRSMGDQLRATPEGPRGLEEEDFHIGSDKAKVIRNPEGSIISAPARFEPLVELGNHRALLAELDRRAGTQRGKSRSRDPDKNPLGCRVFDMGCGWPLYRQSYGKTFRYLCGLYQQSHGKKCAHNHINGPGNSVRSGLHSTANPFASKTRKTESSNSATSGSRGTE